jgi:hypothetical protein
LKLKIGDQTYPLKSVDELSLLDLLLLERETRDLGRPLTLSVISDMEKDVGAATMGKATVEERRRARQEHPDAPWLLAVSLWASRRAAGDKLTFEEAISFPLSELSFVREPGDPEDTPAEADPTRARPGSGRAGKPQASRSSTRTSSKPSTTA